MMINLLIFFQLFLSIFSPPKTALPDQPQFAGGQQALSAFLTKTLVYPEYSKQNCISGTITVSFNISLDNKPANIKVQQGYGIDLDEEAMRIVKMTAGKWILPPNYNPATTLVLPVNFNADATRCGVRTQLDMQQAVAAYKAREALVSAVANYYKNKYLGKADQAKEPEILALKKQLGLDEDYAQQVLDEANQKYKQGDKDGACEEWNFIRNIGSNMANAQLAKYCN